MEPAMAPAPARVNPLSVFDELVDSLNSPGEYGPPTFVDYWSRIAGLRPDAKATGRLLALAGAFLCGPVEIGCLSSRRWTDRAAVRMQESANKSTSRYCRIDVKPWVDDISVATQLEVNKSVAQLAFWLSEASRQAASACIDSWFLHSKADTEWRTRSSA
eukprot:TRINITY_DN37953_c0_g1_i2.p1 TRINITY_DN37953_c0_g1~~TRINITY_DN37953_c0_g1_i2.p1  ORF type:complete len:160 (-),score=26.64 TRINITY_DN37953_c0_g1_i2:144-623(-)